VARVAGRLHPIAQTQIRAGRPSWTNPTPGLHLASRPRPSRRVKNRLHLDLISDTFDAETERLLSLGAQRLRDLQRDKSRWTTFADIEGNEFDLIAG
jgi:hypothetical protein